VELSDGSFTPELIVIPGKEKSCRPAQDSWLSWRRLFILAPDPDREGEAIAAHLEDELKGLSKGNSIRRVTFNEITAKAVHDAFEHTRDVDRNLVDAQQTRRVLDRIVGYQISPLLWDKVRRGLSAGRVQTVALRLIVGTRARDQSIRSSRVLDPRRSAHSGNRKDRVYCALHWDRWRKSGRRNSRCTFAAQQAAEWMPSSLRLKKPSGRYRT